MKIASGFMQGTLSRIIQKWIFKKLGITIGLKFESPLSLRCDEEKVTLHLDVMVNMPKDELSKILKELV